jgi:hypothetical protein
MSFPLFRPMAAATAALGLALRLAAAGETGTAPDPAAAFRAATPLAADSPGDGEYPAWSCELAIATNITAVLTSDTTKHRLSLRYSDEATDRVVLEDSTGAKPAGQDESVSLSYPQELKRSPDGRWLYIRVITAQKVPQFGWRSRNELRVFDLEKRSAAGVTDLEPPRPAKPTVAGSTPSPEAVVP